MELKHLKVNEIKSLMHTDNFLLMDCRNLEDFSMGYIPGSVFVSFDGSEPVFLTSLFPENSGIVIIAPAVSDIEAIVKFLNKSGFTNLLGYSITAFEEWKATEGSFDLVIAIDADELAMDIPHDEQLVLVDVRSEIEFAEGHLGGAQPLPLNEMGDPANIALIPELSNIYLYCDGGKRSMTAATLLKRHGIHNFRVVLADWEVLKETTGLKIEKDTRKLN
jgi:hydroxyacylglutathione hydrolase